MLKARYKQHLGTLVGQQFQDEVCVRLARCIADFQRVPPKPFGDGGLDGLSHNQTRAYCCYGPEQQSSVKIKKGLVEEIVTKFKSDLRTIFEVKLEKRKLVCGETPELASILANGSKLENIYLIVSVFETHRVIGPLNQAFADFKIVSKKKYASESIGLSIWGPEDLVSHWPIDEHAQYRCDEQKLLARIHAAQKQKLPAPLPMEFDAKFNYLRGQSGAKLDAVNRLSDHFKEKWAWALIFESELSEQSPALHQKLEQIKQGATVTADLKSSCVDKPQALILAIKEDIEKAITETFQGQFSKEVINEMVDGQISRLLGECPIEWRPGA